MPTSVHTSRYQLFAASAVAALWLTACGGGGGGGDVAAAPPPGGQAAAPAPAPGPGTAPAPAPAQLTWTARLSPKVWHWISSDAAGDVLVAGEAAGGSLNTSTDGGATWTTGDSTPSIWISSDMSASGNKMVAVQFSGGMFMSTNFGVNWTQVTDPLVNNPGAPLRFESVTMSQDGTHLAAVMQPTTTSAPNGRLALSADGGATWTEATIPGPLPTGGRLWRSIDSSADGQVIVAVEQGGTTEPGGRVFLSTDAGATFSAVTVALTPGTPITEGWYRVKTSADGNTIALAANDFGTHGPGSGIFVSHDRGATWTRGFTLNADYTALAMSADGTKIAATVSNPNSGSPATDPGQVLLSTDGGATFAPVVMPGTDTDWRAIAMSSDGTKMAAATGNFLGAPGTGQLYTSP